MDEFEKIDEAFKVIQSSIEKVGKKHLATFGRSALNEFAAKASKLRGEAINLKFETGG